jgi:hypothetical protein
LKKIKTGQVAVTVTVIATENEELTAEEEEGGFESEDYIALVTLVSIKFAIFLFSD